MSGYYWARTPENELFVVLVVNGKGFVPGVEGAIDLTHFAILEPVKWPSQTAPPSLRSGLQNSGARAAAATRECAILPFVANG
jgi:hypothetical protein